MGRAKGSGGTCSLCKNRAPGPQHYRSTCPWRDPAEENLSNKQKSKRVEYQVAKKRRLEAAVEAVEKAFTSNGGAVGDAANRSLFSGREAAELHAGPTTLAASPTPPDDDAGSDYLAPKNATAKVVGSKKAKKEEPVFPIEEQVEEPSVFLEDDPRAEEEAAIPSFQKIWMQDAVTTIKESIRLVKGPRRNSIRVQGTWPHKGSYWVRPRNVNFPEPGDDGRSLRPMERCLKKLFVWVPEYVQQQVYPFGVLPCPWCKKADNVKSEGFNPHGPRQVYGLNDIFFIICKRYRCGDCKKSYNGYAREVIDMMAPDIADDFPCVITHKGAVSIELCETLRKLVTFSPGLSVSSFHAFIKDNYLQTHARLFRAYISAVGRSSMAVQKETGYQPTLSQLLRSSPDEIRDLLQNPNDFPLFFSKEYGGSIPSETYLMSILIEALERREKWLDRRMQMVSGLQVIKADGSYKIAKRVQVGGENPHSLLYTVLNQYHQVAGFTFLESESGEEIGKLLEGIKNRCELNGFEKPEVCYVDNCCQLFDVFSRHFESLSSGGDSSTNTRQVPSGKPYQLSAEQIQMIDLDGTETSDAAANHLCEKLLNEGVKEIGFDIEWVVNGGGHRGKISLVQVAYRSRQTGQLRIYLFRTRKLFDKEGSLKRRLPYKLGQIFRDGSIKKAGRCVGQDAKKMTEDFGVTIHGSIELAELAAQKGFLNHRKSSLRVLCEVFLNGAWLDKSENVRLSDWEARELNEKQMLYAAKDAAVSLEIYEKLILTRATHEQARPSAAELRPGIKVNLLSKNERKVIGQAQLVQVCEQQAGRRRSETRKQHTVFGRTIVVNKKRVVVRIAKAYLSGSILPLYVEEATQGLQGISMEMAVNSSVVWPIRCLRIVPPGEGQEEPQVTTNQGKHQPEDYAGTSEEFDTSDDRTFRELYETAGTLDPNDLEIDDEEDEDDATFDLQQCLCCRFGENNGASTGGSPGLCEGVGLFPLKSKGRKGFIGPTGAADGDGADAEDVPINLGPGAASADEEEWLKVKVVSSL